MPPSGEHVLFICSIICDIFMHWVHDWSNWQSTISRIRWYVLDRLNLCEYFDIWIDLIAAAVLLTNLKDQNRRISQSETIVRHITDVVNTSVIAVSSALGGGWRSSLLYQWYYFNTIFIRHGRISNHISVLNLIVNYAVKLYTLFKYNITQCVIRTMW